MLSISKLLCNQFPELLHFLKFKLCTRKSTLCSYGFDYFRDLIYMEAHSTCLFVTGSFHLAFCPRGSSMLEYVSQFPSFFRLDSIQLSAYATFHFCIHPVMNIWVASASCPLWIMLLWTRECKYLFEGLLLILWEVGMLDHMVIMCLKFCGNAILFFIASQC